MDRLLVTIKPLRIKGFYEEPIYDDHPYGPTYTTEKTWNIPAHCFIRLDGSQIDKLLGTCHFEFYTDQMGVSFHNGTFFGTIELSQLSEVCVELTEDEVDTYFEMLNRCDIAKDMSNSQYENVRNLEFEYSEYIDEEGQEGDDSSWELFNLIVSEEFEQLKLDWIYKSRVDQMEFFLLQHKKFCYTENVIDNVQSLSGSPELLA